MSPIAHVQTMPSSWTALPAVTRGIVRLAAFVAAWWIFLSLAARA